MTPIEQSFTNEIRIEAIKKQIFEYKYRLEVSNSFDSKWWFKKAIEALEKRILIYK